MTSSIALPRGFRDFDAVTMRRRTYLLGVITAAFERYGFMPLATPAMEGLETLMGKCGIEGDRLLFKVLESGDFMGKVTAEDLAGGSAKVLPKVAHKGLRYDLTVPLARYVSTHLYALTFPFRRYQVQPVWRADRPQRGRYREFYQCDADIVGAKDIFYDGELLALLHDVFATLGIKDFAVALNHRGLLLAIADHLGMGDRLKVLCTLLDKCDKIGVEGVQAQLQEAGVPAAMLKGATWLWELPPAFEDAHAVLTKALGSHPAGGAALADLQRIYAHLVGQGVTAPRVHLVPTLARGMDYYTGAIFEAVVADAGLGSLAGGGRYDNLMAIFNGGQMAGVGLSFGMERLYELLLAREGFPATLRGSNTQVLWAPMEQGQVATATAALGKMRVGGIAAELYPPAGRLGKALTYAAKLGIPWVAILGEEEVATATVTLKELATGKQERLPMEGVYTMVQQTL